MMGGHLKRPGIELSNSSHSSLMSCEVGEGGHSRNMRLPSSSRHHTDETSYRNEKRQNRVQRG